MLLTYQEKLPPSKGMQIKKPDLGGKNPFRWNVKKEPHCSEGYRNSQRAIEEVCWLCYTSWAMRPVLFSVPHNYFILNREVGYSSHSIPTSNIIVYTTGKQKQTAGDALCRYFLGPQTFSNMFLHYTVVETVCWFPLFQKQNKILTFP